MPFILVCLDVWQQAAVHAGYASPLRRIIVIASSGFYIAIVGWWAGGRIVSAWKDRDHPHHRD
jgi:hypothetical protein